MPARARAIVGAPCWVDLTTSDSGATREFYGELFRWTADEPAEEFGGYFTFAKDGVSVAGCMPSRPDSPVTDLWSVYLASDDARKTLETTAASGGQVHVPAMDVGDLGTMAVIGDPGGAAIGVWQPKAFAGFGVVAEPGTPSWFELHTRDYDKVLDFYRSVFGWDTEAVGDTPEFRYTVLSEGDSQLAGVMDASGFLPEGVPSHWSVYFGVTDTDATLAKATSLGGSVVMGAESTPYGRLGTAADPNGAAFKLVARS